MEYHRIRRISEINYYLAEKDLMTLLPMTDLRLGTKPLAYFSGSSSSHVPPDNEYVEYNAFRNKLKRYEKKSKAMDVRSIVTSLYKFLKEDDLITDSLRESLVLLADLDTRAAAVLLGWRDLYKDCFISDEVDFQLSEDNWLRTLEVWTFFKGYKTPWELEKLIPKTHEEWVTLYSELIFIMHIPHLYIEEDNRTNEIICFLRKNLDDSEKYTEDLQRQVDSYNQEMDKIKEASTREIKEWQNKYYNGMRKVSADYNKILASQVKELQRLRDLLKSSEISNTSDISERGSTESLLYELPEYGVTFISGAPAILNRLRSKHPMWDFVDAGTYPDNYPTNEFCFVNVSTIPHKQFYHIKANCNSTVLCCNLTNVVRLEEELKILYTKYILGKVEKSES